MVSRISIRDLLARSTKFPITNIQRKFVLKRIFRNGLDQIAPLLILLKLIFEWNWRSNVATSYETIQHALYRSGESDERRMPSQDYDSFGIKTGKLQCDVIFAFLIQFRL